MSEVLGKYQPLDQGIKPDIARHTRFWTDSINVLFGDGGIRPFPGQSVLFDRIGNLTPVIGMLEGVENGPVSEEHYRVLYYGTNIQLFRFQEDEANVTDVSRAQSLVNPGADYSGIENPTIIQRATSWSLAKWGDWTVATNGIDEAQLYRLGSVAAPSEGQSSFHDLSLQSGGTLPATFTAEIVRVLGAHLIMYHTDAGPNVYAWSDEDDPLNWDFTTLASAAGFLTIRDLGSEILAVEPLGGGHAVYGGDNLFFVRPLGAPFYFGHDKLLSGIGAFGKNCIAPVGERHFGFGPRGIFVTDGSTFQYIDKEVIHKHIYDTLDRSQASKFAAIANPPTTTVQFFWITLSGEEKGIAYNYKDNTWNPLGYYRRSGTTGAVFDFPFMGDTFGNVFKQGIAGAAVATPGQNVRYRYIHQCIAAPNYGDDGYGTSGWYGGVHTSLDESEL